MLKGKRILLGITGGIAAYKAAVLVRLLVRAGADVRVAMTEAATHFVTPVTFQAKSPVRSTLAPSARIDLAVLRTSSPSSRPEIEVSPTARAPKIRARCEIDLSPGTRALPDRGPEARDSRGVGWLDWVNWVFP